ncbi:unnamed protein product [Brassicogethes aeneus]|uniref:CRAL-TRIO domain-containing protein n=1 Tax=Brassicogethes aeneus TaxID=1431903 RepID=A0A9P0BKG0_BRAAE|nr:unnamed protein product [Brassicogethes aeneus]
MTFTPACVEEEYKKDPKLKKEDVKKLMEWIDMQAHLPKVTELQVILFLHSCMYSNEQAKITIDNYFTVKTLCEDIFGNRNDLSVLDSQEIGLMTVLPKKTPEGYIVILMKLIDCDPDKFVFAHQIRNFDMNVIRHLNTQGTSEGVVIVVDMDGMVFGHLTKLNIIVMKKFMFYLQEAMPIRIRGLHYINVVSFMDKVMALIKPFMNKELLSMFCLHSDLVEFYKTVPIECMPKEYGGENETIQSLKEKERKSYLENKDFYNFEDSQKVDEKKRAGKPKNASDFFGVEGTFKKLEVD